jgi:hypothetical protein
VGDLRAEAEAAQARLDAVADELAELASWAARLEAAPFTVRRLQEVLERLAALAAALPTLEDTDDELDRLLDHIDQAEQLGDQGAELGAAGAVDAFHPGDRPTTPAHDQHDQQSAGPTAAELPPIFDSSPDQILAAARAWVGDPGLQATDLTGEDREAMATLLKAANRYVGLCRLQGIEPDDPAPGPREGPGRWEFAGEQYRQAGAARDAAAAETRHPDDQGPIEAAPARLLVDDGAWLYQGFHGTLATRRLRIWRTVPGQVTAVVTEAPEDGGTSITNAIESVIAQLRVEYPDDVEVIEHYLPRKPDRQDSDYQRWTLTSADGQQIEFPPAAEHIPQGSLDRVTLDARGNPVWQRITPAELARRIGGAPE